MSETLLLNDAPAGKSAPWLKKYRFTSETAAHHAKKSHEPYSARFVKPIDVDYEGQETDEFRRERLAIVRAQLKRFDRLLAANDDPNKLDRLVSAIAKLNEVERQLSGRPMPPTIKAGGKPSKTRTSFIDLAPIPSASDTPTGSVPSSEPESPKPESSQPAIPEPPAPNTNVV